MKGIVFRTTMVTGAAVLFLACSDNRVEPPSPGPNVAGPNFAETVAANGSAAACMADDGLTAPTGYVSANLLSGGATAPSFGCTANDIRVATAVISEYSLTGTPGSFIPVSSGTRLECVPNQTLYVHTVAKLANNAQSRYDIGVWIANPTDASAMSVLDGSAHECRHYNLVVGQTGVSSLEVASQQDACGDMSQGTGLATLDLDVLAVTCQANTTTVTVNSCIGWQNSDDFKDRGLCPANYPNTGTPQQFRWGTLPETGSKCNCEGFSLPIDVKASLTLVKTITNDNGGSATLANFPLTATGPKTISGVSGTTSVTARPVDAGTYALSEQTVANYTAGSWSCTGTGTQSGSNITLGAGGVATCTINNNDVGPRLTLVKVVTNDNGGTATTANFPLTAAGPVTISGTSGSGSVTNAVVSAGTYNLSETAVGGYTPTAWSCSSGGSGSQVTLTLGGSATCTIGNNDVGPTLTLVKVVTNDNGGTLTTANFPLTAVGPVTISGNSGSTAVTGRVVSAGTYTLSEETNADYVPSAWSCSSGGSGSQVTLPFGGSATCTIGNNDIPASMTLVKRVIGVGGVTLTFNLAGSDLPATTDLTPGNDATAEVTFNNLAAGLRTITELVSGANFIITDIGCVRPPSTTPFVIGNTTTGTVSFTLLLGDHVTCTFVNQRTSQTTRTQGFWSTHFEVTQAIWFGGTLNGQVFPGVTDKTLCGRAIDTMGKLLGGFWASIPKTTTGAKRSDLDQARMRLLQQLLAAILNNAAFGSVPTGSISIADAKAAYCGTNIDAIKAAQAAMAAFNEGGDAGSFDPGFNADPKLSKSTANEAFWNILP